MSALPRFELDRIAFRQKALDGELPGIRKASWCPAPLGHQLAWARRLPPARPRLVRVGPVDQRSNVTTSGAWSDGLSPARLLRRKVVSTSADRTARSWLASTASMRMPRFRRNAPAR